MDFTENKDGKGGKEEVGDDRYDSLRDDNPLELALGETLPWHLIIPGLIEMWSALKNPYEAYDDVAYNQDDHSYL